MDWKRLLVVCVFGSGLLAGLGLTAGLALTAGAQGTEAPVGLSLFFQDSAMPAVTLAGTAPRYLQEIDLVATVPSQVDLEVQPLLDHGELASLDWSGVKMVDEDWRPAGDGTFIRQRFYRHARWMEQPSHFEVVPTDDAGRPVGQPLLADAGREGQSEDGFVRHQVNG